MSAKAQNATVKDNDYYIKVYTAANTAEAGANRSVSSPDGSGTPVTTEITTKLQGETWTASPTWTPYNSSDKSGGYATGFSHGHTANVGPSPQDVWAIFKPIFNLYELRSAPQAQRDFYQSNASVTTFMPDGAYIVTSKDWGKMADIYNNSYSNDQQQKAFIAQFETNANKYITDNSSGDNGLAEAYALMQMFPDAINVYVADANSTVCLVPCSSKSATSKPYARSLRLQQSRHSIQKQHFLFTKCPTCPTVGQAIKTMFTGCKSAF